MIKKLSVFSIFMILVLALSACGPSATTAPEVEEPATEVPAAEPTTEMPAIEPTAEAPAKEAEPYILRVGVSQSISSLNPVFSILASEGRVFRMVYEYMFLLNLESKYEPYLAESWTTSEDGKTWVYQIHNESIFHDGTPLTAEDVAYSLMLYKSREDSAAYGQAQFFESVTATGDYEVTIVLTDPLPNLADKLANLPILPKHIWESLGTGDDLKNFTNAEMIGSGPFKFTEFKKGEFVRMTANKEHWLYPPNIDEVIYQEFTNEDAELQALLTGQIDAVMSIPLTAYNTVKNTENVAILAGLPATPHVADIILNGIDPANCPEDYKSTCGGHPALRDVEVRKALNYATDKQKIIDVNLMGLADPGVTLVPSGTEWFNTEVQDYLFDIAKANEILDNAGYKDTDGDGVRQMPDGTNPLIFDVNFETDCNTCPREAELMTETYTQIGVQLVVAAMEGDALIDFCNPRFEHDIILWGWVGEPDPDFMLSIATTAQIVGWNSESGYSNPEYDALYDQQAVEMDHDKRLELVWQMQEILVRDVVYIIPYYDQYVYAVRTDKYEGWPLEYKMVYPDYMKTFATIKPIQ
ncbi:MAG: ABC transporter substrate-binding protein [Chloroflexi bacterium]|nr:ABC transporter substrate-binding protein [Chloroflexota bacterium]